MSAHFNSPKLGWTLFHHMPRTGGTWFEQVLKDAKFSGLQKVAPRGASRHGLPDHFKDDSYDQIVTIVRHPDTWWPSNFRFLKGTDWRAWDRGRWHPWSFLLPYAHGDFKVWMDRVIRYQPAFYTRLAEQVIGMEGCPRVTRIMRFETLQQDVEQFLIDAGLPKENAEHLSRHGVVQYPGAEKEPTPQWDAETLMHMRHMESAMIHRFYADTSSLEDVLGQQYVLR